MFIKMKESKGFTLVELMIVVAIIGILAAVAVPFYQKYIQKARLTSKVFPGMHAIETNMATYYSFRGTFGQTTVTPGSTSPFFADADTNCFTPSIPSAGGVLDITIASGTCLELKDLAGQTITATAQSMSGKITGWVLGGSLAEQLGLAGEQ